MNHLVFGSNSPAIADLGELLYNGQDGDEAVKAIADNSDKFAVLRRTLPGFESVLRVVQNYDPNHPAVKKADPVSTESVETPAIEETPVEQPASEPQVTPEPKQKRSTKK
jgi:hypothetical protein